MLFFFMEIMMEFKNVNCFWTLKLFKYYQSIKYYSDKNRINKLQKTIFSLLFKQNGEIVFLILLLEFEWTIIFNFCQKLTANYQLASLTLIKWKNNLINIQLSSKKIFIFKKIVLEMFLCASPPKN